MIMVMMIPFWKRLIVIVSIEMTWGKIHAAFDLVNNQFYKWNTKWHYLKMVTTNYYWYMVRANFAQS